MEENVFISRIVITETKKPNTQVMTIYYYDKLGEKSEFISSIMKLADMDKYKKDVLKVLNCKNLTQMLHTPILEDCTRVCDENITVGLTLKRGFIGKSSVEIFK